MTPNIQGPNGPYETNYTQPLKTMGNSYNILSVPDSYYQDRLTLSTDSNKTQGTFQDTIHSGATQIQGSLGGPEYNGTLPSQNNDINELFNATDILLNSLYYPTSNGSSVADYNNQGVSADKDNNTSIVDEILNSKILNNDNSNVDSEKVTEATTKMRNAIEKSDSNAIFEVLESLTPEERAAMEIQYADTYAYGDPEALREDLKRTMGDGDGKGERQALDLLNEGALTRPLSSAIALHDALEGPFTDNETINQIMDTLSPEELAVVSDIYDKMYADRDDSGNPTKTGLLQERINNEHDSPWNGLFQWAINGR